jgi:ABC-type transport system involved in multi-copper enzyme maturation permease subunit
MVGPVLHQELLLGGRRNRLHVIRWVYAGWLVIQLLYFYLLFLSEESSRAWMKAMAGGPMVIRQASAPEVVGGRFTEVFVRQQMLLLALLTPAFVAGAVTDEKRRGTLQYLLLTDLDARHIVLGKLLGRAAQVALVLLAGLPLFALLAGFGGVEPWPLLASVLVLAMPLIGLAAGTLLASALCRQTREAVLTLYVVGLIGAVAVWYFGGPLRYLDPLYVLEPAWGPSGTRDLTEAGQRLLFSGLAWGLLAGACAGLAVWRLRPAYIAELESPPPRLRHSGERWPMGDDPVRWREQHVENLAPIILLVFSPVLLFLLWRARVNLRSRAAFWVGIATVSVQTALAALLILERSLAPGKSLADVVRALLLLNPGKLAELMPEASTGFLVMGIYTVFVFSLVIGIRCSGAVTGERERQTWEALLLTPISAKQLIRSKLWGILGASFWYLLAFAAPAVSLAALAGPLALFWTVLCLTVAVLAMYFIGATGLWCSTRARNSWRALLSTLGVGYVGGILLYLLTTPVVGILSLLVILLLYFIDLGVGTRMAWLCLNNLGLYMRVFFLSSCIALALAFWGLARVFLTRAQRWVADRERTRHWYEEPIYRKPRRADRAPSLSREG